MQLIIISKDFLTYPLKTRESIKQDNLY
jgi:hypothetical protein